MFNLNIEKVHFSKAETIPKSLAETNRVELERVTLPRKKQTIEMLPLLDIYKETIITGLYKFGIILYNVYFSSFK